MQKKSLRPLCPLCPLRSKVRVELPLPRGGAELAQRVRLDLADPLAGEREGGPDLLEGVLPGVVEAEAPPQDVLLPRGEHREQLLRLLAHPLAGDLLVRRRRRPVGREVADLGVTLGADGRRQAERLW